MLRAQRMQHAGFTLIELMVTLAIAALLLVLAMPGYSVWMADAQIRSAAENIAGGLRYVQAEAIKRNEPIQFILDPTTGSGGWTAQVVSDPAIPMQSGQFQEGARLTQIAPTPAAATTVTFNGLGFIVPDPANDVTEIAVTHPAADSRSLTVLIGGGRSGIKICDPKWTLIDPNDPKGCPAAP